LSGDRAIILTGIALNKAAASNVKDLSTQFQVPPPSTGDPPTKSAGKSTLIGRIFGTASAACLFVLLGAAFIPYAGVQNDEVIFANPLYLFSAREFSIGLFHRRIALMVLSYLGTLKTLLYIPILALLGPNVWSLRLPMVLVGGLTILIFFGLARRTAGLAAAVLGAFLLASDASFILTDTFDWGPVAIEHFLLVTGCFCLVKFSQKCGSGLLNEGAPCAAARWSLFLGFFLFGLALWNKAIFIWALAGLSCAAIAVLWPEIRRWLRPATAAIACAAFLAGALPLVVYNVHHPNVTAGSNTHFETNAFRGKFYVLLVTLNGSAMFGFLSGSDNQPNPKPAASLRGRAADWIGAHTGRPHHDAMVLACGLALLLVPWWWKSRTARFSLVFMCATWLAMAVTRDAGMSAHHSVLLWPFPQLFVATALASLPWRKLAMTAGAALVAINLLVVNQAIADFERNGAIESFSDAVFPLSKEFTDPARPVITVDWGIVNVLSFLHHGQLTLRVGDPPFKTDSPSEEDRKSMDWLLLTDDPVFVTHVPGLENTPEVRPRLDRAAAERGLRRELIKIVPDSNGRPVFEIFRFVK
jgi:4-amino-4-deoxy-L-arabinose transferase-like glycosyltransferase